MKKLTYIVLVLLPTVFCDAPRHNPLDPGNPDSPVVFVSGEVKTRSLPHTPLCAAELRIDPGNISLQSDNQGQFRLTLQQRFDTWLHASKPGYLADSVYIEWQQDQKHKSVDFLLNALPELDSLALFSIVLNNYPDKKTFRVKMAVCASDADNDIDSVLVCNQELGFSHELIFNSNDKVYERTFFLSQFNIESPEALIGQEFNIWVHDLFSHRILLAQESLKRIVEKEIDFVAPANYKVVPPQPRFVWQDPNPGYSYTTCLQVYTDEIAPQLIWEQSGIAADSTAYTCDVSLGRGDYFWVIWCVDRFQNRSRSKPASFRVE